MLQETLHAQSCTLLTQLVNVNQIKQPNCCHSFHLVSCGDFEIGWRGGWMGQYLRKKLLRNANGAAAWAKCLMKEMPMEELVLPGERNEMPAPA